uniref:Uncharacterized protein n=1 Tax=Ramularia collo-cygni TaxID=112498 RepID=A0A2D3V006_9PEZI
MYRTNDPRFRRRLNEIGQTLESANETAQSSLYIFGQKYVRPCFASIGDCVTGCVDASCPRGGDRVRRQKRRSTRVDRAEVSFDFYDDWDEDETDGLLGWGNDEFDRLVGGGGTGGGYGTVAAQTTTSSQPGRQRGMSYPKGKRRSVDAGGDATIIQSGNNGFWGKLFGGKPLKYHPSAADLQDHPGTRRLARDITEGEALLEESGEDEERMRRTQRRARSGTQASHETASSYSSRGDLFPSDNEDDAIPLDDEFAMVLERRTTQSGMDTENSSNKTTGNKRGKRPSTGSRTSTRRTFSSRSSKSGRKGRSRTNSSLAPAMIDEASVAAMSEAVAMQDDAFAKEAMHSSTISEAPLSMSELEQQERDLELEEEAAVERKREEAIQAAVERGLTIPSSLSRPVSPGNDGPQVTASTEEPSQLPTPLGTDDEDGGSPTVNDAADPPIEGKGVDGSD